MGVTYCVERSAQCQAKVTEPIFGYDCLWLPVAKYDCLLPSMIASCQVWLPVAKYDCQAPSMIASCQVCQVRLPVANKNEMIFFKLLMMLMDGMGNGYCSQVKGIGIIRRTSTMQLKQGMLWSMNTLKTHDIKVNCLKMLTLWLQPTILSNLSNTPVTRSDHK